MTKRIASEERMDELRREAEGQSSERAASQEFYALLNVITDSLILFSAEM